MSIKNKIDAIPSLSVFGGLQTYICCFWSEHATLYYIDFRHICKTMSFYWSNLKRKSALFRMSYLSVIFIGIWLFLSQTKNVSQVVIRIQNTWSLIFSYLINNFWFWAVNGKMWHLTPWARIWVFDLSPYFLCKSFLKSLYEYCSPCKVCLNSANSEQRTLQFSGEWQQKCQCLIPALFHLFWDIAGMSSASWIHAYIFI